jgi:KTSC domain
VKAVRRRPVTSSAVSSVGYDAVSSQLEVEFVDGDVYRYSLVPRWRVEELLAADSIGSYVNREIKPRYPGVQVG